VSEQILEGQVGQNSYKMMEGAHLASSIYILNLEFEGKIISRKVKK